MFQRYNPYLWVFALLLTVMMPTSNVLAQFVDVASTVGITTPHDGNPIDMGVGSGGAWLDYDNDGDLDFYMTMRLGANFLYENNAGVFTDVAAAAGAQDVNGDGGGVVVADFNNDGCQDLYLANTDEDAILQNNCDGTFTDVTVGSGLDASGARRGTSASVGDYDGDGLLDLYVAHHTPVPGSPVVDDKTKDQDYLFHNDGNFVFTDVSDDMLGASDRENASFIGAWTDFDNDGDLDIYLIRDCGFDGSGAMDLWRNDGGTDGVTDWTFTQMASSVNGNWCQNGMGVAVGDYDRNGYMDLFYTDNGTAPGGTDPNRAGTVLLANSATGFTDMTDVAGVASTNFSWGANFFDFNNDGYLDIFMAAGSVNDAGSNPESQLWESDGSSFTYSNISSTAGVNVQDRCRNSLYADYDQDGDLDMALICYGSDVRLFRNDNSNGYNYLIVDLVGTTSNADGIGARIEVTSAGGTQVHEVRSGSSLGGGDDIGAHFGLGTDATATTISITWPSGTVQTLVDVAANQRISVTETSSGTGQLFTDVSAAAGVGVTHMGATDGDMPIGTGAAWFDYDNDGDQDLYMTNREGNNWLFENNGGVFTDVAVTAGAADGTGEGAGVAAADFNNDGCVDLYLANTYEDALLQNNCDGTFTDIIAGSGLEASDIRRGTSASWGDFNEDGLLDLYVSHHMPAPLATTIVGDTEQDYLYHNNGDGTFTDVSDMLLGTDRIGRAFITGWTDYDRDGDLDLYMIRDCPFGQNSGPMQLFRNDGGTSGTTDWTFTEISDTVGADWCQNGMGLAVGDYDNNGWMDFFFTDNGAGTDSYPDASERGGAVLLANFSGQFTETTDAAGVANTDFSWGANFFDYDLDMDMDLYQVAGAMDPLVSMENTLFQNNNDGTFTDVSLSSGGLNDPYNSRTSAMGDYDGDGDLDMFSVNYGQQAKLFRNDNNNGNNWVQISLQGTTSNRDGIGAWVEVTAGGITQHYETRSGSSLGAGDQNGAFFGLGSNFTITDVTITWPSGIVQNVGSLGINQSHLIVEPAPSELFTDVTSSAGVSFLHDGASVSDMSLGTGAAWFDFDNDGDQDLYVTQRTGANKLFENNGGTFTDVAATAGVQDASNDGSGVAVADYDNDGDKDLFLANSDNDVLFRNNGDGTFTDVTAGSGLESSEERRGTTASWGDYDDDGNLDLYVSHHMAIAGYTVTGATEQIKAQDYIYYNNGDGTFTDVSDMLLGTAREGMGFIGGWTDYDQDGDLDVFVIHDCPFDFTSPQQMFRNDGGTDGATDWTFTEVSATVGVDYCQNGMGLAVGDYDRDGDFDFFFSDNGSDGTIPAGQTGRSGTMLLRNDGGTFSDATDIAGVSSVAWSWGTNFFDYDNDGFQDLYLAAGAMNSETEVVESVLWQNNGDATFTDVSTSSGGLNDGLRTRTSVYSDYDEDGDLDMFLVNYGGDTKLFRNNNSNGNNWVIFDLEGVVSNRDGIGARLVLNTSDGVTQHFETRSGSSLGGGDDLGAHFGIASAASITNLTVYWPSGNVQSVTGLGINQRHLIVEEDTGLPSTLAVDPASVDFGQVEEGSSSAPSTITLTNEGDSSIDVTDVSISGTNAGDFSHAFAAPVTIAGGATSTFDVTFTPIPGAAPALAEGVLFRVNAGGALVGDWEEDTDATPSSYLLAGSTNIETDDAPITFDTTIPVGTPIELFEAKRIDANQADPKMEWDFPVTLGQEIEVRLYFVEMSRCSADNRLFDVTIEGTAVLSSFDVYTEAGGCNVGTMRSFTITPLDENLDIDFPLANGKPSVLAGIEILGSSGVSMRDAQVTVVHTGANGSLNVDLTGEALANSSASVLSASVEAIDFGSVSEGETSDPETVTLTNAGSNPVDVTAVTLSGTDIGDFAHTFTAPVTIEGGATATFDVTFAPQGTAESETATATPQPLLPEGVLYRVNAGGALVDDWEEDTAGTPSPYVLDGSTTIETDDAPVTFDTTIPVGMPIELFETKRRDANQADPRMEWDFPVTAGEELEVRLFFIEMSRCATGNRLFDVLIEGNLVLDDFDVYTESGSECNQATMRSFTVTTDGNLDIDFPLANGRPSTVAAIEIVGTESTTSPRSAQLAVEHTGVNGPLNIDLAGNALASTGGGGNELPTAAFTSAVDDNNNLLVHMTSTSTDTDGTIVCYQWDFDGSDGILFNTCDEGDALNSATVSYTYPETGYYDVTLQVMDNEGATDLITMAVPAGNLPITPFMEAEGLVVMEAENYFTSTPENGDEWTETTAVEGFSGSSAMEAGPNDGSTSGQIGGAEMTYDVEFSTLGVYYVWARVYAPSSSDNSLHMGDNGNSTAIKMNTNTYGEWVWTNVDTKGNVLDVDITAGGVQPINVWMREDGLVIDKIVLTQDAGFTPEGMGPAESGRVPAAAMMASMNGPDGMMLKGEGIDLPTEFALEGNYPNPFNPTTTIQFALPEDASVTLEVFDATGRLVSTLINGQLSAGRYESIWNGRNDAGSTVASGMYLYRLRAGSFVESKTMLLMK